jgi:hypothetical protein
MIDNMQMAFVVHRAIGGFSRIVGRFSAVGALDAHGFFFSPPGKR